MSEWGITKTIPEAKEFGGEGENQEERADPLKEKVLAGAIGLLRAVDHKEGERNLLRAQRLLVRRMTKGLAAHDKDTQQPLGGEEEALLESLLYKPEPEEKTGEQMGQADQEMKTPE